MEKDHECTDGELQGKGLLHTQNHLEVNFKWFSKGSDRKRNCFLQETELLVKPGHLDEIYSHLGDTHLCAFQDRTCDLGNGRLIWDVKTILASHRTCLYQKMAAWNGSFSEMIWDSHIEEFSLSFNPEPETMWDCGIQLALSQQTFAVPLRQFTNLMRKVRRLTKRGVVTTSQLAAQLTAISPKTRRRQKLVRSRSLKRARFAHRRRLTEKQ